MLRSKAFTTCLYHEAGLIALVSTRPRRPPPRTMSDAGRMGGGQVPMPGEVSGAPHGPRCLDERPECRRHVLEVLRQRLEEGVI